eukprot:Protomagalhaensia_sp_Gyna_25__421@NODE_119_length_5103_cov_179_393167_g93_i0_p2_GENE_NODE_119_length_5103_cov_179_393167_g93_i0NODE_119_length_5103_cov_179_393167_g93_i0_p2_ORF_typecomplete_len400_score61_60Nop/PF01798_18/1_2e47Prp31_C/PF09785_9/6_1e14_NODE_119_length_5103_cov_179_393167_g93_i031044303
MADLAASFLKDLEGDEFEEEAPEDMAEPKPLPEPVRFVIPDAVEEYLRANARPDEKLIQLLQNEEFITFIEDIKQRTETNRLEVKKDKPLSREAALRTLAVCNDYLRDVDVEILGAYAFIRDLYNNRFPELEPLLPAPLDYIHAATRLKNELDASTLSEVLPNSTVMTVTVAASITMGRPLSPVELDRMLSVTEEVTLLVDARRVILAFIEQDLLSIAPNLTALVGASMAARLLVFAQSLENLSSMPSGNIPLLGGSAHARATTAFATEGAAGALPAAARAAGRGYGVLWQADIVQTAPPVLKVRALKLLAGKCGLAARRDVHSVSADDDIVGRQLREQVLTALKRLQEPPPARQKKPLPVPDDRPRPRRGGKRYRRLKEKYGMTELKKEQNRLPMKLI